jgi:hypothetical protein
MNLMTNTSTKPSQGPLARVTGCLFLLSFFLPMLNWVFVNSRFVVAANAAETVRRVAANEGLFRLGLVNDLLTAVVALGLALTLYLILRSVNRSLALLALLLKVTEGVLLAATTLGYFVALLILKGQVAAPAVELGQMQALVGLAFNTRMAIAAVPMVFLGLNFTIFLSLLYKSKYVPASLAGFGVFSYLLIFVYSLLTMLFPDWAAILVIQSVCWTPSCVFELAIGIWLLGKGLRDTGIAPVAS